MCGRFSNSLTKEKIKVFVPELKVNIDLEPSYNISPSHKSAIIINKNDALTLGEIPWGVLPYNREKSALLINARSETVFEKPTFSEAILKRRCLVVADSFYEWKKIGKDKMPYRITLKNQELMIFAGVYNMWKVKEMMYSGFVIMTTEPNQEMKSIHKRAPVILKSKQEQLDWVSNNTEMSYDFSTEKIKKLMKPIPDNSLHIYKVSNALNKATNNSLDLHREIPEPPTLF